MVGDHRVGWGCGRRWRSRLVLEGASSAMAVSFGAVLYFGREGVGGPLLEGVVRGGIRPCFHDRCWRRLVLGGEFVLVCLVAGFYIGVRWRRCSFGWRVGGDWNVRRLASLCSD